MVLKMTRRLSRGSRPGLMGMSDGVKGDPQAKSRVEAGERDASGENREAEPRHANLLGYT